MDAEANTGAELSPEDGTLVRAAMAGEPDATRLVWDRHRRWIAGVILAYKPRRADLEDLLQEVASVFVRRVGELRDPRALKPWLRTVAMNAARLSGRKLADQGRRESGLRLVARERFHSPATPQESSEVREEADRTLALALDLPESYREPLLLRCLQGMSYAEIGRILGLPETTIETRIARGRRMLRERASPSSGGERLERGKGSVP